MAAELENRTFLAISSASQTLYTVSDVTQLNSEPGGAVNVWKINPADGSLLQINSIGSIDTPPCYIGLSRDEAMIAIVHYGDGRVVAFQLQQDGVIGPRSAFSRIEGRSINKVRQTGAHAHGCFFSPDGRLLVVPDLGTDRPYVYQVATVGDAFSVTHVRGVATARLYERDRPAAA